jgi:hypothetical protein
MGLFDFLKTKEKPAPTAPHESWRTSPPPTTPPADRIFVGQTSQGSGRSAAGAYQPAGGSGRSDKKRLTLEKDIDEQVSDAATRKRLIDALEKNTLTLEKFELDEHIAMVALLVDFSISMEEFYQRQFVQRIIERFQVLGLNFDDNGALDTFMFSSKTLNFGELSLSTLEGFFSSRMKDDWIRSDEGDSLSMGGTDYVGALDAVFGLYKDRLAAGPDNDGCDNSMPMFVIFVTDGAPDPGTEREILRLLAEMSAYPIYVKAICLQNSGSNFSFMNEASKLRHGMQVMNFDYTVIKDPSNPDSSGDLNEILVGKYRTWIEEAKACGILLSS